MVENIAYNELRQDEGRVLVSGERTRLVDVVVVSLLPAGTLMLAATRFFRVLAKDVTTSALTK